MNEVRSQFNFFLKTIKLTLKPKVKSCISIITGLYYDLQWNFSRNQRKFQCLNITKREIPIVVSLTSFPGRINTVSKTIHSILNQKKVKPDVVELWLARSQFEMGEAYLPENLLFLQQYGLRICWCEDIRSYKKLIPTVKKHQDAIIVTADDDVYYRRDWLEKLYFDYLDDKQCIYCHKATKFQVLEGEYSAIGGGKNFYLKASYLNKLVGVGGVLYPPNSLHCDVCNRELFTNLAPTNDDIWFWLMAVLNGTRVKVIPNNNPKPIEVYEKVKSDKLSDINDRNEQLFWVQFKNILSYYPEIDAALKQEYALVKNDM